MSHPGPSPRSARVSVRVDPTCFAVVAASIALVLVCLSFTNFLLETYRPDGFRLHARLFTVNREANIPTWFQVINLSVAALLAYATAQSVTAWRRHWYGLAAAMLFVSLDELTMLHEQLARPLRALLDTSGFFYQAWIIPGVIVSVVFALIYVRFLKAQPRPLALGIVLAGVVFVAGAIGMEGVSGAYADNRGIENIQEVLPQRALRFMIFAHIEELLEMIGIVLFNSTLLTNRPAIASR